MNITDFNDAVLTNILKFCDTKSKIKFLLTCKKLLNNHLLQIICNKYITILKNEQNDLYKESINIIYNKHGSVNNRRRGNRPTGSRTT